MTLIERVAARVLLVDADERLLLVHERMDIGGAESHWITPGGGVEDGETLAQAAMREVFEETGLWVVLSESDTPIHSDDVIFSIAGQTYRQRNHYFFSRCDSGFDISSHGHTELEKQVILGYQWWDLAELAASSATREPAEVVRIVKNLLARVEDQ